MAISVWSLPTRCDLLFRCVYFLVLGKGAESITTSALQSCMSLSPHPGIIFQHLQQLSEFAKTLSHSLGLGHLYVVLPFPYLQYEIKRQPLFSSCPFKSNSTPSFQIRTSFLYSFCSYQIGHLGLSNSCKTFTMRATQHILILSFTAIQSFSTSPSSRINLEPASEKFSLCSSVRSRN